MVKMGLHCGLGLRKAIKLCSGYGDAQGDGGSSTRTRSSSRVGLKGSSRGASEEERIAANDTGLTRNLGGGNSN